MYGLADLAAPFIQFHGTLGECYRESKGMGLCGIYRREAGAWVLVAARYWDSFTHRRNIRSAARYAQAYRDRFEQPLADDGILGPAWLKSICGARELLNGDGAVAMAIDRTTDSKDNGCCESMFWHAMELAGFEEADIV